MSNANLYAVLESGFPVDRQSVAIETPELCYTWDDMDRASACLANLLASLKLPAGARVAVQVEKSPEALLLYLATLRAGLVYLPLNTAYREAEIEYFLGNAEPDVVVCTPENEPWVERIARAAGVRHIYTLGDRRTGTRRTTVVPGSNTTGTSLFDGWIELSVVTATVPFTGPFSVFSSRTPNDTQPLLFVTASAPSSGVTFILRSALADGATSPSAITQAAVRRRLITRASPPAPPAPDGSGPRSPAPPRPDRC